MSAARPPEGARAAADGEGLVLRIVVVEDHDLLREATVAMLCAHGHRAVGLVCAEEVDEQARQTLTDLYVIDVNLPGEDGFALAQRLRAARPGVGILMTTARTQVGDRVAGYGSGADIYLPKPVDPAELLAAVQSLGQRLRSVAAPAGALVLDTRLRRLGGRGDAVSLTHAEASLLVAFAQAAQHTLERWQVAMHLGLHNLPAERGTLDVRMSQLRAKLLQAGATRPALQAIRGHGYRLCVAVSVG